VNQDNASLGQRREFRFGREYTEILLLRNSQGARSDSLLRNPENEGNRLTSDLPVLELQTPVIQITWTQSAYITGRHWASTRWCTRREHPAYKAYPDSQHSAHAVGGLGLNQMWGIPDCRCGLSFPSTPRGTSAASWE